jgi:hypothetical protein
VAAVLLLVGDAGDAVLEASPLLHRLRADVERWSGALAEEGAVAVAFLGDNVYPEGVRSRGASGFARDSALLHGQVSTVSGAAARAHGTRGLFVAGNHDWGNLPGQAGLARLRNMEALLTRLAASGPLVELVPRAGDPGPVIVELGSAARLVVLDTPWWLQADDRDPRKDTLIDEVASALARTDGPVPIVLAHHPYASGGPHGGHRVPLTPKWLLHKAGALVQDLNSRPYRRLRERLGDVFERAGAPTVFAGGHDHSLQVHRGSSAREPAWMLVSGAGSHVTPVGEAPGLTWSAPAAGYMSLVFGDDGRVDLYVIAAPPEVLECPAGRATTEACVREGVSAFRAMFSARLR